MSELICPKCNSKWKESEADLLDRDDTFGEKRFCEFCGEYTEMQPVTSTISSLRKLVAELKDEEEPKIIEVEVFSSKTGDSQGLLYTSVDSQGNYPLDNDRAVWFSNTPNNKNLKEIDGRPDSKVFDLTIMKVDNALGIYDTNFMRQFGPFIKIEEVLNFIKEEDLEEHMTN